MNMATKDKVDIYLKNDVIKITDKNKDNLKYDYQITYDKKTNLPIKKNQTIGSIIINVNDGTTLMEDLIVKERVNKISFMNQILTNLKTFLTGIK